MALMPEKFPQGNKESRIANRPPSAASTVASSGRKPSADHNKSTSRSSTNRARSTRTLRNSVRSAVPETKIVKTAERPDKGGTGKIKTMTHTTRN